MSFGVVQTMITTLKNNKKLLSKRHKQKSLGGFKDYDKEKELFNFPKSDPKKVEVYRQRFLLEKKKRQFIQIIIYCLVLAISVSFLIYLSS